jgi:L,D-peptidoglycan transpeptidase YkuD (ErfK/YbiS/YcfS/YnhG family)
MRAIIVPTVIILAMTGCGRTAPVIVSNITVSPDPVLDTLPGDCRQAVVVRPQFGKKVDVTVRAFERKSDGTWDDAFLTCPGTAGKNGIVSVEKKKEGDGSTPAGIYALGPAFGYAESFDTRLTYRRATDNDFWVDDPDSPDYNRWVTGKPSAKSFELMKRADDLYELGAVIRYNTDPVVPGKGSAIFLHVWPGPGKPTAGCVAVEKDNLRKILGWLTDSANPRIAIMMGKGAM